MVALLTFFKYFGLVLASCSSSIGIVGNLKRVDKKGNSVVTKGGKAAISLTAMGLLVSGLSIYLQDQKDTIKANQEILKENRKHFDELKVAERESKNENEIMYRQIILDRKQDNIHKAEESAENAHSKAIIAFQVKNLEFLFKQAAIEDYLKSSPDQVDIVIELPYNKKELIHKLNDVEASLFWSNSTGKYSFQVQGIFENSKAHAFSKYMNYPGPFVFITDPIDSIIDNNEIVAKEMSDSSFTTEFDSGRERYVELKEKDSKSTLVILNINYFHFKRLPWERIIDFRGFPFHVALKSLDNNDINLVSSSNTDGVGFSDNSLLTCYLRIDHRFLLKLGNAEDLNNENISANWAVFRKNITLNYGKKSTTGEN